MIEFLLYFGATAPLTAFCLTMVVGMIFILMVVPLIGSIADLFLKPSATRLPNLVPTPLEYTEPQVVTIDGGTLVPHTLRLEDRSHD